MGTKQTTIKTALSVKDCGSLFQQTIVSAQGVGSKLGGLAARMRGGEGIRFYAPRDDSPFAALEEDRPSFAVGVHMPRLYGGAVGETTNVQMHVYDRGGRRDVALISEHTLSGGGHAGQLIDKVSQAFLGADPSATVVVS